MVIHNLNIKRGRKPIIAGIYKITNIEDNRVYIGSSYNIYKRWINHLETFENLTCNWKFKKYLQENNTLNIVFEIIEEVNLSLSTKELEELETNYIFKFSSSKEGYNVREIAQINNGIELPTMWVKCLVYNLDGTFFKECKNSKEAAEIANYDWSSISGVINKTISHKANNFLVLPFIENYPLFIQPYKKIRVNKIGSKEKVSETAIKNFSKKTDCKFCSNEFVISNIKKHENNCKLNPNYKKVLISCPHCNKVGEEGFGMKNFHFENCKKSPNYIMPSNYTCIFCKKEGTKGFIKQWHNDSCKENPNRKIRKITKLVLKWDNCIYCNHYTTINHIKRYHNDNCKHKEILINI